MTITFPDFLLIVVGVYTGAFILIGKISEKGYFKTNLVSTAEKPEDIISVHERAEEISMILVGFALTALTFIITAFNEPSMAETLVIFFSLAFIIEIISAFLYHDVTKGLSSYLGFVFQYAGLLAIISGFFAYLTSIYDSPIIWAIYIVGLIAFVGLTIRELYFYVKYWEALRKSNDK